MWDEEKNEHEEYLSSGRFIIMTTQAHDIIMCILAINFEYT